LTTALAQTSITAVGAEMKKIKTSFSNKLKKLRQDYQADLELFQAHWIVMAPSLLLLLLGIGIFCLSSVFALFAGSIVILLAACIAVLSWRFLKLKTKVERFLKDIEGRVIIGGLGLPDGHQKQGVNLQTPAKKILYH
jgi:Na+/H+ antiporter NhaD/arsenite permease-like protein